MELSNYISGELTQRVVKVKMDQDQTAPLDVVSSGSILFAYVCFSKQYGHGLEHGILFVCDLMSLSTIFQS